MRFINILILSITLTLYGCEFVGDWNGAGEVVSRRLDIINNIDHLNVNNTFEIVLIQDKDSYIEIICSEKFQSSVKVNFENNILTLDNSIANRWFNGYEKVKLELHIPYIPTIYTYKPCKIESRGMFKSDIFYLADWGNFTDCNVHLDVRLLCIHSSGDSFGSYIVKGKALKSEMYCRGSANYIFADLYTDSCYLYHKSIMDISLNVNKYMDVIIESKGDVYYSGDPIINLTRRGEGNLIKRLN